MRNTTKFSQLKKVLCLLLATLFFSCFISLFQAVLRYHLPVADSVAFLTGNTFFNRQITPVGYQVDRDTYTVEGEDGILLFPDLNKKVVNVVLCLKKPVSKDMMISLYYDETGTGFDEDHVITMTMTKQEDCAEFFLNREVKTIRLDVGNRPGDTFSLQSVGINRVNWRETDFWLYAFVMLVILGCLLFADHPMLGRLYRYRYVCALVLCVLCVLFKLHGSSIDYWIEAFGSQYYERVHRPLFGHPQMVRADEFSVLTSLALSQPFNHYGYFTNLFGTDPMDMFIVYGQAVRDISMIFRPAYLGFLFLGSEYGMSFFWVLRTVMLFMVSWDFGWYVLDPQKKHRKTAFLYAVLVLLAPVVQWWFAINGLVEILIFGQLALLFLTKYIHTDNKKLRMALIVAMCWFAGCFVLVFYPAWQISFFYVFLFLAIGILIENKGVRHLKSDLWIWIVSLCGLCLLLGRVVFKSWDTILAIFQSSYPGHRFCQGQGGSLALLSSWSSLFFANSDLFENVCENASFLNFAPVGLVLAIILLFTFKKRKQKTDWVLWMLVGYSVVAIIWATLGFPRWLSKISLMYNVQTQRGLIAFAFAQLLLLFRCLCYREKGIWWCPALFLGAFIDILVVVVNKYAFGDSYSVLYLVILAVIVFVSVFLLLWQKADFEKNRLFAASVTVILAFTMLVNPITQGLSAWRDNQLLNEVQQQDRGQMWMAEDCMVFMGNFLTTAGVKSFNAIQMYPHNEIWAVLDPDGTYRDIYNRYCYVTMKITSDETAFRLIQDDWMEVTVSVENLMKLPVERIVSPRDLTTYNTDEVTFDCIKLVGNYGIYEVKKN